MLADIVEPNGLCSDLNNDKNEQSQLYFFTKAGNHNYKIKLKVKIMIKRMTLRRQRPSFLLRSAGICVEKTTNAKRDNRKNSCWVYY